MSPSPRFLRSLLVPCIRSRLILFLPAISQGNSHSVVSLAFCLFHTRVGTAEQSWEKQGLLLRIQSHSHGGRGAEGCPHRHIPFHPLYTLTLLDDNFIPSFLSSHLQRLFPEVYSSSLTFRKENKGSQRGK